MTLIASPFLFGANPSVPEAIGAWLRVEGRLDILIALLIALGGWVLARVCAGLVTRALTGRASAQQEMISRRVVQYGIFIVALISAMRHAGLDTSVLLGAAGIVTVALGFASQTSASNLISGFFLMGEKPFVVGDTITVGTTTGEVINVGLMSAQLRTFDNLLVRIPNETLLRSELTNLTHFPIRRLDMQLRIDFDTSLDELRAILLRVAEDNPICLTSPEPLFLITGMGESVMNVQFSVWSARVNFVDLRNSMFIAVKEALDAAGIQLPVPRQHVTIHPEPQARGGLSEE